MMKHTKVPNPLSTKAADHKGSSIFNKHSRKLSEDVYAGGAYESRNAGSQRTMAPVINGAAAHASTHQAKDNLQVETNNHSSAFHLPNLGKTVSHSMTPRGLG